MLHPRRSAQDVLLCDSCKTLPLQSHCELCQINLCTNCVGKHLLDTSRKHRVVPFIQKCSTPTYPKCQSHPGKHCELYCENYGVPACSTCISSGQHEGHKLSEFMKTLSAKAQGDKMESPKSVSSAPVKPLLDVPRLAITINTGYRELYNVSCLNEDQVWTRGRSKSMKLLDLHGKQLKSVHTESGKNPRDVAVTRNGDLLYTDDETVSLVKNENVQTVVRPHGWRPRKICSTSSDDLLVIMISDDESKSKIVRYSGSEETQTIQFDDQGHPLYSPGDYTKYISENKNLDICVADLRARAVVVVNQSGKLRFRYTGHPSEAKESFDPHGIATDSQSRILIADRDHHRIHIIDQDGQFLRYIQNCGLEHPHGLCVDVRDNLFVAECFTAKVKKIQYL